MTRTIAVTYENGVFRPVEPVDLPEHSPANVQVEAAGKSQVTAPHKKPPMTWADMQKYRTLDGWPEDPVEWQRKMRDEEWRSGY